MTRDRKNNMVITRHAHRRRRGRHKLQHGHHEEDQRHAHEELMTNNMDSPCSWSFSKGLTNLSTLLTKFDDHKFHQIRQYVDATVTKMHKD